MRFTVRCCRFLHLDCALLAHRSPSARICSRDGGLMKAVEEAVLDVGVVWVVFIDEGLVDEVFAEELERIFCSMVPPC